MNHVNRRDRRNPHEITFAALERLASDDAFCLAFFEAIRFPGALVCESSGADEREGDRLLRFRTRPGVYGCSTCRRQFSITSGTAMHGTRLPLGQWLRAIWLISALSMGVSARKLSEILGITWHLGHRVRTIVAAR